MKIAIKTLKKYEKHIVPVYNEDGELKGISMPGVIYLGAAGRRFIRLKWFHDSAKEWLLEKYGNKHQLTDTNYDISTN